MGGSGASSGMLKTQEEKAKGINEKKIFEGVRSVALKRKDSEIEWGYSFSLDGEMLEENEGNENSCIIYHPEDKATFHNHPNNAPFSPEDISSLIKSNEFYSIVGSKDYLYVLKLKDQVKRGKAKDSSKRGKLADEVAKRYSEAFGSAYYKAYLKVWDKVNDNPEPYGGKHLDSIKINEEIDRVRNETVAVWLKNNARSFGYEFHRYKNK